MRNTKGMFVAVAVLAAGLSGCASHIIGVHEGAERVSLAEASQVAGCQSRGGSTISIYARFRVEKDVEANMFQMARNEAADAGADTVVKGESPELGKRTFKFYKCRP